jgi:hypothetical protein
VNAGSTDTLSGVASYVSGGAAHPLADSTLSITSPGSFNWGPISTTVTTASDGSFSYATPVFPLAVAQAGFTVSSAATAYLEAGQLNITLPVNQAAQIDEFTGTINAKRVLQFSACGGIPEPLADNLLDGPLDYQYSRTPHGPWKTLGAGEIDPADSCQPEGGTYPGTFNAPLASAFYRAYAPAVPGQMSAVSQVIHLPDYRTRITGFAIHPRSVRRDGKITVSGRLLELTSKWIPRGRANITIEYRYLDHIYKLREQLRTNSAGRFSGTFRVARSAAWFAVYRGNDASISSASKTIRITVH